jgi:hypothetical protein
MAFLNFCKKGSNLSGLVEEQLDVFVFLALRLGFIFECAHAHFTANNVFFRII